MGPNFEIEFMQEVVDFLDKLDPKAREKIYYNAKKSKFVNDSELFKKLNNNIWEFRTIYNNNVYRLFAFWDNINGKQTLVIVTHGILKKSQKTPTKEIKKAEDIRCEYFDFKFKKKQYGK